MCLLGLLFFSYSPCGLAKIGSDLSLIFLVMRFVKLKLYQSPRGAFLGASSFLCSLTVHARSQKVIPFPSSLHLAINFPFGSLRNGRVMGIPFNRFCWNSEAVQSAVDLEADIICSFMGGYSN